MPEQLTFFVGDSPARTFRWLDSAEAWLATGAAFGLSSVELLRSLGQDGLSLRTSPAFYPATKGGTLPSSFEGWSNWGMASPGGYLTLNGSEYPSDGVACSLSDILETDVPPKYSLSPKACAGILRRAEKRGRKLPTPLEQALEAVALTTPTG